MLVRIAVGAGQRTEALELAQIFDAQVVDVSPNSVLFSVTGQPRKINDFLELIRPFGLVEMAKSGRIALSRETKTRKSKGT